MDILENNADDGSDLDLVEGDDTWGHPKTLGLIALTLATLCLFGVSSLRGSAYTLLLNHHELAADALTRSKNYLVAGTFLSAAFALVPVVIAKIGLTRLVPSDGEWAGHLLRAAFFLGTLAFVLDVVRALLAIANNDPTAVQILL